MSTPIFQVKTVNLSLQAQSPNELIFQCNDVTGAPVDISSGYVGLVKCQSQSTPTRGTEIVLGGTVTYGSTGKLTFVMTIAQTNAVPCSEAMPMILMLSNDSFASYSIAATGFLKNNQAI